MSDEPNILTSVLPSRKTIGSIIGMSDFERAANSDNRTTPAGGFSESVRLAPNGKPSNLTAAEYAHIMLAKINTVKNLIPVSLQNLSRVTDKTEAKRVFAGFGRVENKMDGRVVRFPSETAGKILRHHGFDTASVLRALDRLFADSIPAWSEPEITRPGHRRHRNIEAYHHYVGKFTMGDKTCYVRFTITEPFGMKSGKGENLVHSSFVSDVSLYEESAEEFSLPVIDRTKGASALSTDNKLLDWFKSVNSESVKNLLDENDEPKLTAVDGDIRPNLSRPNEGTPLSVKYLLNTAFCPGFCKLNTLLEFFFTALIRPAIGRNFRKGASYA